MPRLRPGAAAAMTVMLVVAFLLTSCSSSGPRAADRRAINPSAQRFLHMYVAPTGAVVRHDQGGDTVSEGQGYALLLAYAVGDQQLFAKVWSWTQTHLQLPDGLFAYHWQNGAVTGNQPAADADTQIAWALDLAGQGWSQRAYTTAARRVAIAIATKEVGYDDRGQPTLAGGPWAVGSGRPVQVEPGYWTFPAYAALASLTGDHRWQGLTGADAGHLSALTAQGSALPPDWADVGNGAAPTPVPTPSTGAPPASGQDGLRAMVWAACLPSTHPLATRWWHTIAATAQLGPLTRNLDGTPATSGPSPLSLVSAAAVAKVAGEEKATTSLLARADKVARQHPTYYGDAWDALGHVLLTTELIPGCSL